MKNKPPSKNILPPVIEQSEEVSDLTTLKEYLKDHLDKRQLAAIKDMAYKIGKVGMSLDEALLLAMVTKDQFLTWCNEHPQIATFIKIQALEFKFSLLEVATKHATENKDVKTASWLLEKMFNDFDSSLKKEAMKYKRNAEDDIIAIAFATVRRKNVDAMPVNESVGMPQQEVIREAEFTEVRQILAQPQPQAAQTQAAELTVQQARKDPRKTPSNFK